MVNTYHELHILKAGNSWLQKGELHHFEIKNRYYVTIFETEYQELVEQLRTFF